MDTAKPQAAEHLITTRYRKTIWKNFISALKQYEMLKAHDTVAVCVSGGKDSLLLAKCMQTLRRHSDFPFELRFLCMDPGYSSENMQLILDNAWQMGIDLHVFHTDILSVSEKASSPCHICAAMRRGHLYKEAQKLGCNKIALGHHFDDVCETVMLSMLYGGEFKTMMPRLHSAHYEGMQLIRPLYLVREKYIIAWLEAVGLKTLTCACAVTRREEGGKRKEIKRLLAQMEKVNPNVLNSIFSSTKEVNLQTVLSYKQGSDAPGLSVLQGKRIRENQGEDQGEDQDSKPRTFKA